MNSVIFQLPPKGIFKPNHVIDDPLPRYYHPITGFLYRNRIQRGLDMLENNYDTILEFGYGSGILLPTLAKISKKLHGIDIASNPSYVNTALNTLHIKAQLVKKDITKAKYPSNYFDVIVAFSVFEHIAKPYKVLSEMYRILKPKGLLLVGMPRVDRFMEILFLLIGYNTINDHHVKNSKEFMEEASKLFRLKQYSYSPKVLPQTASLYFTMLFSK